MTNPKTTISVTVDVDIVMAARDKPGINVSSICERALAIALKMPIPERKVTKKEDKIHKLLEMMTDQTRKDFIAAMQKGPYYSKGLQRKFLITYGIKLTKPEVIDMFMSMTNKITETPSDR